MKISKDIAPLPEDFQPGEYDVLCGRGKKCSSHIGNDHYRKLVESKLEKYSKAVNRVDKSLILAEVVEEVREKCGGQGGFVKCVAGTWYEVGDFLAREKTSQAFRDLLHENYRSSNQSKKKRRIMRELLENKVKHANQTDAIMNNIVALSRALRSDLHTPAYVTPVGGPVGPFPPEDTPNSLYNPENLGLYLSWFSTVANNTSNNNDALPPDPVLNTVTPLNSGADFPTEVVDVNFQQPVGESSFSDDDVPAMEDEDMSNLSSILGTLEDTITTTDSDPFEPVPIQEDVFAKARKDSTDGTASTSGSDTSASTEGPKFQHELDGASSNQLEDCHVTYRYVGPLKDDHVTAGRGAGNIKARSLVDPYNQEYQRSTSRAPRKKAQRCIPESTFMPSHHTGSWTSTTGDQYETCVIHLPSGVGEKDVQVDVVGSPSNYLRVKCRSPDSEFTMDKLDELLKDVSLSDRIAERECLKTAATAMCQDLVAHIQLNRPVLVQQPVNICYQENENGNRVLLVTLLAASSYDTSTL